MNYTEINNNKFIQAFTEYKHKITSKAITENIGRHLLEDEMTPAVALELATLYKHEFSTTNIKELKDFAKENLVELSENKFKAFLLKAFNRRLTINVDVDDISSKVLNNYDKLTELSARFIGDLGYSEGVQNYYKKNCENIKELGGILVCDYLQMMKVGFKPELLQGKHIYHIFSELGDSYGNISRRFTDMDKLKFDDGMVILPSKLVMTQGGTHVDITDGYGGGYEISSLLRDKDYVKDLAVKFDSHVNYNVQDIVERYNEEEYGKKPSPKQKLPKVNQK